ncbi:uncharacterized protein LOC115081191 [Rhinatrema bivittatum]|uniref:uncharacterized protein LOC115081191 n=1 Tax=Rhinatrema bivittatum TaxID=194408 RepID=UPI00112B6FA8|nr:uncharacterized protein LOC115081191 [Rhinatrema bivittatum]
MDTPQANWLPCLLSTVKTCLLDAFSGAPLAEETEQSGNQSFFHRWRGRRSMQATPGQPVEEPESETTLKDEKEAKALQDAEREEPAILPKDSESQTDSSKDMQVPEDKMQFNSVEATGPSNCGDRLSEPPITAKKNKAGDYVPSEVPQSRRGRKRKQDTVQSEPAKVRSLPANPSLKEAMQHGIRSSHRLWLPALHLGLEQKEILTSQDWLDDKLIDAAQLLLKKQYAPYGLQTTLLSCCEDGFQPVENPGVQIHFDAGREHWFTSCRRGDRVEVADSLGPKGLTPDSQRQLKQCYGELVKNGGLEVHLLRADCQPNRDDCGLYAIANAVEFLAPEGDPTSAYDNQLMRPHLTTCLEKGEITRFPKSRKQRRPQLRKPKVEMVHAS